MPRAGGAAPVVPAANNPWGIDVSKMDAGTQGALRGLNFQSAANSGVNLPPLFAALQKMGATPQQIQSFGQMLTKGDWAGQFGKYAQGDTIAGNLQKFMGGQAGAANVDKFAGDTGHGGWLQHHIGDIARGVINPLDAATGGRISSTMGRLGAGIYDKTAGNMGGWLGDHVFGQHGALAGITRGLNTYSVGALTPGSVAPIESATAADYQSNLQHGMNSRQALGTSVATGAQLAATALTAGGAGAALGTLGSAAANAGIGATSGAARAYAADEGLGGILQSAALSAAPAAIGVGTGGISNAVGGLPGQVAGSVARGAASSALRGDNLRDILTNAGISGLTTGVGSEVSGLTDSGVAGNLAGQLAGTGARTLLTPRTTQQQPQQVNPQMATNPVSMVPGSGGGDEMTYAPQGAGTVQHFATGALPETDPRYRFGAGKGAEATGGAPTGTAPAGGKGLEDWLGSLGGGLGGLLGQLIPALGLGYSYEQSQKDAATARDIADPWGSQRGQYQGELGHLMAGGAPNQYGGMLQKLMTGGPDAMSQDPSYQWRLNQGIEAINRSGAAKQQLNSGNTLADLMTYGQGMASQEFGAEESRLKDLADMEQTNFGSQYNRLSDLAGVRSSSPAAAANAWGLQRLGASEQLGGLAGLLGNAFKGQGGLGGLAQGAGSLLGQGASAVGSGLNGAWNWLRGLFGGGGSGGGGSGGPSTVSQQDMFNSLFPGELDQGGVPSFRNDSNSLDQGQQDWLRNWSPENPWGLGDNGVNLPEGTGPDSWSGGGAWDLGELGVDQDQLDEDLSLPWDTDSGSGGSP